MQFADRFVIVPTLVKDRAGTLSGVSSPSDALITVTDQETTGINALELICHAATVSSGRTIVLGIVPRQMFVRQTVRISANQEVARNVLVHVLEGLRWQDSRTTTALSKLSWELFYGSDVELYALNIHVVSRETLSPTGDVIRRPL